MPYPSLLHPEPLPLWQATADLYLHRRHSNTQRQVWLSLCGASWCTQGSVCDLQESISQSCVSSGCSMVGLMATSSNRAHATPRSAAPRAPAPWQATADPYLHRRHSSTVLAQSLWPFHFKGLECKSRKSRHTWSNRQIRPWSTKQSRSKANRVLPRACTGHSKRLLPTTREKTLHVDITRWSTPKSD